MISPTRLVFRICTLVTDWQQYAEMKQSFIAAGFDESRCAYSAFDNSSGNHFEPYSLINRLVQESSEPYLVLCHQDVLANQGDGFDRLLEALRQLDSRDPHWAVAGNAGCTDDFAFVIRVTDPNKFDHWPGPFPVRVHSLDENFLVIRGRAGVTCSSELSGFHLYGTDLCLNARLKRRTCYVIDFHLTHQSTGRFGEDFFASRRQFIERWNREFHFLYVIREAEIFLSRWRILHRVFPRCKPRNLLRRYRPLRRLMTLDLDRPRLTRAASSMEMGLE